MWDDYMLKQNFPPHNPENFLHKKHLPFGFEVIWGLMQSWGLSRFRSASGSLQFATCSWLSPSFELRKVSRPGRCWPFGLQNSEGTHPVHCGASTAPRPLLSMAVAASTPPSCDIHNVSRHCQCPQGTKSPHLGWELIRVWSLTEMTHSPTFHCLFSAPSLQKTLAKPWFLCCFCS